MRQFYFAGTYMCQVCNSEFSLESYVANASISLSFCPPDQQRTHEKSGMSVCMCHTRVNGKENESNDREESRVR